MRCLVTGGYGFIGSAFIQQLLNKPEVELIVNIDCVTYAANIKNLPRSPKLRNFTLNIGNKDVVGNLLEKYQITHVVHFAAETHVDNSISNSLIFVDTNINGTHNLLQTCREYNGLQRFHHISTDEVYGSLKMGEPSFTEVSPYKPRSPYAATKAASDHLVQSFYHTFNLPITISNCSNNYGPRQNQEKLIPKVITNLLTGVKIPLYGEGINVRDWLFVDDHCDAIWSILQTPNIEGEVYNIGGNCELTNIELIKNICKLLNKDFDTVVEFVQDRAGHDLRYSVDFTKINNQLNWSPRTSLLDGLKSTIEYYSSI